MSFRLYFISIRGVINHEISEQVWKQIHVYNFSVEEQTIKYNHNHIYNEIYEKTCGYITEKLRRGISIELQK